MYGQCDGLLQDLSKKMRYWTKLSNKVSLPRAHHYLMKSNKDSSGRAKSISATPWRAFQIFIQSMHMINSYCPLSEQIEKINEETRISKWKKSLEQSMVEFDKVQQKINWLRRAENSRSQTWKILIVWVKTARVNCFPRSLGVSRDSETP